MINAQLWYGCEYLGNGSHEDYAPPDRMLQNAHGRATPEPCGVLRALQVQARPRQRKDSAKNMAMQCVFNLLVF
jgi:hypothetical protein